MSKKILSNAYILFWPCWMLFGFLTFGSYDAKPYVKQFLTWIAWCYTSIDMYSYLLAILVSLTVSIYWFVFLEIRNKVKMLQRKPFNCQFCFPVWIFLLALPLPLVLLSICAGALLCGITAAASIAWIRNHSG